MTLACGLQEVHCTDRPPMPQAWEADQLATGATSTLSHLVLVCFSFALSLFFGFVLSACLEDYEETVHQSRVLIVDAACNWKVIPLHRLA